MLDNVSIQNIIPHRYPFLLIDKVLEITETGAVGIKNVTANEPFFQGHFPGRPIMPGVLQVEALAQLGAVVVLSMEQNKGKLAVFTGMNNFKFRRQVVPGDVLRLEATMTVFKRGMGKANVKATVDGELACSGEIGFAIIGK